MRITVELGRAKLFAACHWQLVPTYWRKRWLWIDLRAERSTSRAGVVFILLGIEFAAMWRTA